MAEETKEKKLLQWHPAFFAGLQIEFAEEANLLTFENEHQLSKKPLEIDVLIVKKNAQVQIKKNIGRIFRKYNIFEYKSPEDYLSIDDFYKVYGYACFYKSDSPNVDLVKSNEITISFVCEKRPEKLLKHLRQERQLDIMKVEEATKKVRVEVTKEVTRATLLGLLRDGLLSVTDVAVRLKITEAEVEELLAN